MDIELLIKLSFFVIGLVEIIIAIPLFYGKIKPNIWYGFRVSKTLDNKEVWYKANKYMAKDLIVAGCILAIGSISLIFLDIDLLTISLLGNFLLFIPLITVIIRGVVYLKKL